MPKQIGTYRAKGKMQGRSYYTVKDGVGDVFRSINPAMSERVKTAPEFVNTRKYANEFGVATGMSQEVCNVIRDCTSTTISPVDRSRLTHKLGAIVKQDTQNPLGQRTLNVMGWQDVVREFINNSSRNSMQDLFVDDLKCVFTTDVRPGISSTVFTTSFTINQNQVEEMERRGISHLRIVGYWYALFPKEYQERTGQYLPTSSLHARIIDIDQVPLATEIEEEHYHGTLAVTEEERNNCIFMILSVIPQKEYGTEKIDIKSLSSWYAIPLTDGNPDIEQPN